MNLSSNISDLSIWLQENIVNYQYADVSIIIRIHDGKITLIEKAIVEKVKPNNTFGNLR